MTTDEFKEKLGFKFDTKPWKTSHEEVYNIAQEVNKLTCLYKGVALKTHHQACKILDMLQSIVDRELKKV